MKLLAVAAVLVAALALPLALAGDMTVEIEDPQGGAPYYLVLSGVHDSVQTFDPATAGPDGSVENATVAADYANAAATEGRAGPELWQESNGVPGLQRVATRDVIGRILAFADTRAF